MFRSGIEEIEVSGVRKNSRIYFHTKGMFKKDLHGHITNFITKPSVRKYYDLDFVVYEMLDFVGKPCQTKPLFNQDACTETKLEKKSLEIFGCTTPFGTNMEKICQNYENGSNVMDLYREAMEKKVNNCYSPCSFLSAKATKTQLISTKKPVGHGHVSLDLNANIVLFEAQYLYSALSMIAEIGGYVGLFLGISVNQISALINFALDSFDYICKKKKGL